MPTVTVLKNKNLDRYKQHTIHPQLLSPSLFYFQLKTQLEVSVSCLSPVHLILAEISAQTTKKCLRFLLTGDR